MKKGTETFSGCLEASPPRDDSPNEQRTLLRFISASKTREEQVDVVLAYPVGHALPNRGRAATLPQQAVEINLQSAGSRSKASAAAPRAHEKGELNKDRGPHSTPPVQA